MHACVDPSIHGRTAQIKYIVKFNTLTKLMMTNNLTKIMTKIITHKSDQLSINPISLSINPINYLMHYHFHPFHFSHPHGSSHSYIFSPIRPTSIPAPTPRRILNRQAKNSCLWHGSASLRLPPACTLGLPGGRAPWTPGGYIPVANNMLFIPVSSTFILLTIKSLNH